MSRLRAGLLLLGLMLGRTLAGCGEDNTPHDDAGMSVVCDALRDPLAQPGDPIDGDNFENVAQPFFATYCVRCHSSELVTFEARGGAPLGFNWDDATIVREQLPAIRNAVGVANFMPFNAPFPSCAERERLVRWIDAAAP